MIDLNPCIKPMPNPAVACRKVTTDEVVLVNLDNGVSVALNFTGALIWELSNGRRSVEEIARAVHDAFPNAPSNMADDVSDLVRTLAEDGFIGFEFPPMDIEKKVTGCNTFQ